MISEQVKSFCNGVNCHKASNEQLRSIDLQRKTTADSSGLDPGSFKATNPFIKSFSDNREE